MRTPILDKVFLIRLNSLTYQQLANLAEHQKLSKAAIVRLAVTEYLTTVKETLAASRQQQAF